MKRSNKGTCMGCRFWEPVGGEIGACHRFPPFTPCFDDRGLAETFKHAQTLVFVETFFDDWCGEWCGYEG